MADKKAPMGEPWFEEEEIEDTFRTVLEEGEVRNEPDELPRVLAG